MSANESADVLARAARCLRQEQDAALAGANLADMVPSLGEPTWSRIVGDVRRARQRRRWIVAATLQLGIGLCGLGVWAAVTGRMPTITRRPAASAVTPEQATPARRRSHAPPAPSTAAPATTAVPSMTGESPPEVTRPPAPAAAPPGHRPEARPPAAGRPARSDGEPRPAARDAAAAAAAADALYREAHHLHFVRRDFSAAIAAWDRYLAMGTGALSLEARYNRAIALAHLGRRAAAVAALRPFADGETGSYRQAEARALIERFTAAN
jgi:hypothetical protein